MRLRSPRKPPTPWHDTLAVFRDALGVQSFNAGAQLPPLSETPEDWRGFPCVIRIVDRGPLGTEAERHRQHGTVRRADHRV